MIGVGILGYGFFGAGMARCIGASDRCALTVVADTAPDAIRRAGLDHPDARLVSDWREAIEDPRTDAFIVATPFASHFEIALAALRAGKHVLVQKPFTATADQAGLLVQEALHRDCVLMVDHTPVYTPAIGKMKQMVDAGDIGNLYYYDSVNISLSVFNRDINVLWGMAVDDLSVIDHVIGASPIVVSACAPRNISGNFESVASISLYFDDGLVTQLGINWLTPIETRRTLIAGSRRMVVYDDVEPTAKLRVYDRGVEFVRQPRDIGEKLVAYRTGDAWVPHLARKDALVAELEHFADCIANGTTPLTPGLSGLRVVRILEAAMASLRHNGHPVELRGLKRAV